MTDFLADAADVLGHERTRLRAYTEALERDLSEDPVTGTPMPTQNRWTALDARFLALIRQAPPVQKNRIRLLHTLAGEQTDVIEYAEALLTVGEELVKLQQKIEWREDGAA